MSENLNEQFVGATEAKLKPINRRLNEINVKMEKINSNHNETVKLSTLMEIQIEHSKQFQEQLKLQHDTLINVNANISGLNENFTKLNTRVETLEESRHAYKIDLGKLATTIIYKVVPGLVLAWLVFKYGL
ncbi:MAG: hypothetical protein WD512_09775 [Candidatus Paceibacterota bacterium]